MAAKTRPVIDHTAGDIVMPWLRPRDAEYVPAAGPYVDRNHVNVTENVPDILVTYVCPGCGLDAMRHPPLCPVLVRLHAADMQRRYPDDWQAMCLSNAEEVGWFSPCRWSDEVRHWHEVASEPPVAFTGAVIVWDGRAGLYYEYHSPRMAEPFCDPPRMPPWYVPGDPDSLRLALPPARDAPGHWSTDFADDPLAMIGPAWPEG